MERSTKFWLITLLVSLTSGCIYSLEFLLGIVILYFFLSLLQLIAFIGDAVDSDYMILNPFYWLIYKPIVAFNNWLDN
jgi:hypothetical protein